MLPRGGGGGERNSIANFEFRVFIAGTESCFSEIYVGVLNFGPQF